jgi:phosphoserine aminotransferase
VKPSSPDFSSGPCKKRPGWTVDALSDGALGRSHRSALGKAKLKKCIEDQKRILGIPDDYHLGIVPVSYLHCCFCMSLCSLMFILQQPPPPRSVTNTGQ